MFVWMSISLRIFQLEKRNRIYYRVTQLLAVLCFASWHVVERMIGTVPAKLTLWLTVASLSPARLTARKAVCACDSLLAFISTGIYVWHKWTITYGWSSACYFLSAIPIYSGSTFHWGFFHVEFNFSKVTTILCRPLLSFSNDLRCCFCSDLLVIFRKIRDWVVFNRFFVWFYIL